MLVAHRDRLFATPWSRTPLSARLLGPGNSPGKNTGSEVAQSCPTLCDPTDCSLPGSSVHGKFQARTLQWVAISFSRGISRPRGSNPSLPHCRQTLYRLSHRGSKNTGVGGYFLLQGIFLTTDQTMSPAMQAHSLLSEPPGKPRYNVKCYGNS